MTSDIAPEVGRDLIVRIAREYIRTPYHWWGQIKGVGVDCLTLVYMVYRDAGLIPELELPHYSQQWHLHRSEELYLNGVLQWTHEIPDNPLPGDIVLYRIGRCFAHGGIVSRWPEIIHADENAKVVMPADGTSGFLADRPHRFFSYW
jgi:cell wall-associated NlpC family hydrolase